MFGTCVAGNCSSGAVFHVSPTAAAEPFRALARYAPRTFSATTLGAVLFFRVRLEAGLAVRAFLEETLGDLVMVLTHGYARGFQR